MTWFGNLHLAGVTTALAGHGSHPLAVAVVDGGGHRVAVRNAHPAADFEIASVSKGITGLLYCDAVDRGAVSPQAQLGQLLPLPPCPAAHVTLENLSNHTSGLPAHVVSRRTVLRTLILGTNPYGGTLDHVMHQTSRLELGEPKFAYSNLGFTVLGHAVARAQGMSYPALLQDRLCEPLGLNLYAPYKPSELRPSALRGRDEANRQQQPWTGEDIAPSGGIRGSITDLASLAAALLQRTAPGLAALEPSHPTESPDTRIGAAWYTTLDNDREVTWHNGGSGGVQQLARPGPHCRSCRGGPQRQGHRH